MLKTLIISAFLLMHHSLYADTVFIDKLYEKGHYETALAEYEKYVTTSRLTEAVKKYKGDSKVQSYSNAIYMLAVNFFYGKGVEKNRKKAICLLYESALYGNVNSIHGLNEFYSNAMNPLKNSKKAETFRKVIDGLKD